MLLQEADPCPYIVYPATRSTPFILVSDHAGRQVPKNLGNLGVGAADWERHIAWDIGIHGVGLKLHERLGATLIEQTYSRLVIDCNRSPGHKTSIPDCSDGTDIPENMKATAACRSLREAEILHPYHDQISTELNARLATGEDLALIALHSFTPCMNGITRPWHAGILHHKDTLSARLMIDLLRAEGDLCVGDNEPYVLTATSDYTVPRHAEANDLPYLEIEIRQDLIADEEGQNAWAQRLERLLTVYWSRLLAARIS